MPVDQIAKPTHKLIDVREVARRLGCSWRSVYLLHDSGRMPAGVKVGSLRGCEFFVICTVYADQLMDVSPGHSVLSDVRHTKSQRTNDEKFTASQAMGRRPDRRVHHRRVQDAEVGEGALMSDASLLEPEIVSESKVELALIVRDPEVQPREELDPDTVEQYAEAMLAGAIFPPVVVYHDRDHHWLSQGFHRCEAAEQAGFETIRAEVRRGTRQDALWDAAGSNREHDTAGMRRSNADKRRAVLMALAARPGSSDRAIAEQVGVDHKTVGQVRARWGNSPPESRTGVDERRAEIQVDDSSTCGNATPGRRTGLDGKSYPATNGRATQDRSEPGPEPERKAPATGPRHEEGTEEDPDPPAGVPPPPIVKSEPDRFGEDFLKRWDQWSTFLISVPRRGGIVELTKDWSRSRQDQTVVYFETMSREFGKLADELREGLKYEGQ